MNRNLIVIGFASILVVVGLSGCVEQEGTSVDVESWEDGMITLNQIEYDEYYDSAIGDYRTVDLWLDVNYDVYIDTQMWRFQLKTSKDKTINPSYWGVLKNGILIRTNAHETVVGTRYCGLYPVKDCEDGQMTIKMTRDDSPSSFVLYLYRYGVRYSLDKDETITAVTLEIYDAHERNDYTIQI